VSSKTTLVVTDDANSGTKKILDARRLNVPIISYEELEEKLK
jgi:BRCT domain type II-containing protein